MGGAEQECRIVGDITKQSLTRCKCHVTVPVANGSQNEKNTEQDQAQPPTDLTRTQAVAIQIFSRIHRSCKRKKADRLLILDDLTPSGAFCALNHRINHTNMISWRLYS
jgi:hypothetical protein